jgi:hypothetical protein
VSDSLQIVFILPFEEDILSLITRERRFNGPIYDGGMYHAIGI